MGIHHYLPHTPQDIAEMLERCGASSLDDLYADVPAALRLKEPYGLPEAMSEPELTAWFAAAGRQNRTLACFAGAGFYSHYTPACIKHLTARSEFVTAYTPYQPEISQGTLQYIFEYQSMMCALTGMDICNASIYDGSTATAEAMLMAVSASRRRRRVLVTATVAPVTAQVMATYAEAQGITLEVIPQHDGACSTEALEQMMEASDVAAVVVASPNYYGILEDYTGWADICHKNKALLIVNSHASALGAIRTPTEWGADIACGEAQSLGIPMNYGGPGLGYLCCRRELMRKMPGRIVGATTDASGRRSFVLTLQAREQHIRRHKATSNICSNQGIMTLHAAIYLSLMGAQGLRKVNALGCNAAHLLARRLEATGKVKLKYADRPFLNEFALETTDPLTPADIIDAAARCGILAGVDIGDGTLLVAATETTAPADIDRYVELVNSL